MSSGFVPEWIDVTTNIQNMLSEMKILRNIWHLYATGPRHTERQSCAFHNGELE